MKIDEKQKIEINKSIAYFMGWRIDNSFPDKGKIWRSPHGDIELETTFKFSIDYNRLMEVFDAVNKLEGVKVSIKDCDCTIFKNGVTFNRVINSKGTQVAIYECLGEFILEYNKQQLITHGA